MKKTLIIITAVIACIIVAIAGLILAYTSSSDYTADHLPQKTSINGIDCSNLTYDEAFSQLSDEWNKKTLTVVGSLNDKLAEFTHFDCTYDIAGQIRSIKEKHLLTAAMSHYLRTPFSVKIPMTVKTCGDSFKEQVMNSEFLNNPNAKASTDAYVDLSDPDFPIVPEKMGTAIDKDRFFQAMLEQIQSGNLQMIYDEKKYNDIPKVTSDGDDYESPVSYWMGITPTGIGFHDASWRSSFGGSIWRTNGSHGCVNMPTGRIPEFYRQAEVGMPVVMHY